MVMTCAGLRLMYVVIHQLRQTLSKLLRGNPKFTPSRFFEAMASPPAVATDLHFGRFVRGGTS